MRDVWFLMTSSYSPAPTCSPVSSCRGRLCHARVRFLAANCPPALVDVSFGRGDGRGDVRVAHLVCNAPVDFHSFHVSIEHLDVPDPFLTRIPRVRASLAIAASAHAGGRPDGDGRVAGILIISVRSGAVRRDVRPVSGVRRARATWTDIQRMVPATGSVTTISMVLFCLSGPGTFRFEREFWAGSGEFSVPRSLCTLRSARSADIFRSVHGVCYPPGEAERIP